MIRSVLKQTATVAAGAIPHGLWRKLFRAWLGAISSREPDRALSLLLSVEDDLTAHINLAAGRYGDGVHVKHRLTGYHDFFVERIGAGERVLDVGCGNGALTYDIAVRTGARVTGIEIDHRQFAIATKRFSHPSITFIEGDVLSYSPESPFDVIVLSNVLEHIAERLGFLRGLVGLARPRLVLIRVPALDRHWKVPLRKELGMRHFSDPGHYVEYTVDSLRRELSQAGLALGHFQINWGEIWAEAYPGSVTAE